MSKIKVVQIIYADDVVLYLDDKGNVWYDGGHSEQYTANDFTTKSRWVQKWEKIDLPEESK